jgi:hypothetical protein
MCNIVSIKRHLNRRDAHIHRPRNIQRKRRGETNMRPTESYWDRPMQGVQAHLMLRHSPYPTISNSVALW